MVRLSSAVALVGALVALATAARTQAIQTWERRIDRSPWSDSCLAARVTADGTTTIFGAELVANPGFDPANVPGHGTVTRVDPQGQVVWSSDYDGGSPSGRQVRFVRGALDANGGCCAIATSRPVPGALLPIDTHVVRYDAQGNVMWTAVQANSTPRDVAIEPNGNVWVVTLNPAPSGGDDVLVMRFDASGALTLGAIWSSEGDFDDDPLRIALDGQGGIYAAVYSSPALNPRVHVVRMAADSNVTWVTRLDNVNVAWADLALDGTSALYASVGGTPFISMSRLVQLDPATGIVRWERATGGAGLVRPQVELHPAGGVATAWESGDGTVQARRYDALGELLWSSRLPGQWGSLDALAVDADGAIHLGGVDFNAEFRLDSYAAKLTSNGTVSWLRRHTHAGESSTLRAIGVGPNGSTILVADVTQASVDDDIEIVRFDEATTSFCSGDGSGASCPCGNSGASGNGCANTVTPAGAKLASTGNALIGADDFVLVGSGMTNASVLYFQGTASTTGSAFGDGLRCAVGVIVRLGTKSNVAGSSVYPEPFDAPVSVRGGVVGGTQTRTYQAWYRNAAPFCTPSGFNLTNGLSVIWSP